MDLHSLGIAIELLDLLLILLALVLKLLKFLLQLSLNLAQFLPLGISFMKSFSELSDFLLVVLFLTLEDEDSVVLEAFLGHLLESLNGLCNRIDVLHEGLAYVVRANGKSFASDQLNLLIEHSFFLLLLLGNLLNSLFSLGSSGIEASCGAFSCSLTARSLFFSFCSLCWFGNLDDSLVHIELRACLNFWN